MVWIVLFVALLLVNLSFTVARAVDAVKAQSGNVPGFSLLLVRLVQPESRLAELAVLAAMPGLSILLPVIGVAVGIGGYIRGRRRGRPRTQPFTLIAVSVLCLLANTLTTYAIFYGMPSF
jgi:hypothetical protein